MSRRSSDADEAPVAAHAGEEPSPSRAGQVTEVVSDDGARRGRGDDAGDAQAVRLAGVGRGEDEGGLSREGHARALDGTRSATTQ